MSIADKLFRDDLTHLVPYQSARRIGGSGDIWLNANESPYQHDYDVDCSTFNRYPEFQPPALIAAYANYAGVNEAQLLTTRGADEAIELLIRTFCKPGRDSVTICTPTYGMYKVSAETNGCEVVDVPLDSDYLPDVDKLVAKSARSNVVFLCSPNNPTGHLLPHERVKQLLSAMHDQALIVVDEAYIEFAPKTTVTSLLEEFDNLVVLRTLSKAYALAGLRCGFCIANASVIEQLTKVIPPYPVPAPVAAIAEQALSESGRERMRTEVSNLNAEKAQLAETLSTITETFPCNGNFILIRVADADGLMQAAAAKGIVLRNHTKQDRLQNCVRLTIGSAKENAATLAVVRAFCQEQQ